MKKRNLTFKQKLKNVLIFAIVLFLSLELLSWLLIRCGNYSDVLGNHNSWGIYAEKENTIDVAAFGSSNYYSGIQPLKCGRSTALHLMYVRNPASGSMKWRII